jgi:hypothetical protein
MNGPTYRSDMIKIIEAKDFEPKPYRHVDRIAELESRIDAMKELLSRETDEGPVMSLMELDDPHKEQRFFELLNGG